MKNKATLLSSMRARLTFWYSGVLALVLLIFAISTYSYLARAARQRTDDSLSDTLSSFSSNFNNEREDENHSPDDAVREAAAAFHFPDRQVLVYDYGRNVIIASEMDEKPVLASTWFTTSAAQPQLNNLLEAASRSGRAYTTI